MKSFRIRLALLSTLISAVIIAGIALGGSLLFKSLLLESVDLQLNVPLDRIARECHPHADFRRIFRNANIAYGRDIDEGKLLLMIRDDPKQEIIYQKSDDWIAMVDSSIWDKKVPDRQPPASPPPVLDENYVVGMPRDFPTHHHRAAKGGKGKGPMEGPPDFNSSDPVEYFFVKTDSDRWRVGVQRNHGYSVYMARNLSEFHAEMSQVVKMLVIGAPFCLLVIAAGGWFIGHRAIQPLAIITETADSITTRALHERIPVKRGEYHEFANLIVVLNRMMDRLEQGFTHAMRFSGDVSHELKTPITIMQAELNSALKECEPGSREEKALQVISQESHRLKSITGSLMLLSQAESGRLVAKEDKISLSNELSDIAEDTDILCDKAELTLESEIEPEIKLVTDQTLLHQALLNLVSNAIKYNTKGGWIKMALKKHDISSEAIFRISNSGPGIPEEEQELIFERFYRVNKARDRSIDGFGLGLNLSHEIFSILGGELELIKADSEQTIFQVRLPVES